MTKGLKQAVTAVAVVVAVLYTAGLTVGSFIHKLNDELAKHFKDEQTEPKVQQKTEAVVIKAAATPKTAAKTPRKPRAKVVTATV